MNGAYNGRDKIITNVKTESFEMTGIFLRDGENVHVGFLDPAKGTQYFFLPGLDQAVKEYVRDNSINIKVLVKHINLYFKQNKAADHPAWQVILARMQQLQAFGGQE